MVKIAEKCGVCGIISGHERMCPERKRKMTEDNELNACDVIRLLYEINRDLPTALLKDPEITEWGHTDKRVAQLRRFFNQLRPHRRGAMTPEMCKARDRTHQGSFRKRVLNVLRNYRTQHLYYDRDMNGGAMKLVDVFSPCGNETIRVGRCEIEALADYLASELRP